MSTLKPFPKKMTDILTMKEITNPLMIAKIPTLLFSTLTKTTVQLILHQSLIISPLMMMRKNQHQLLTISLLMMEILTLVTVTIRPTMRETMMQISLFTTMGLTMKMILMMTSCISFLIMTLWTLITTMTHMVTPKPLIILTIFTLTMTKKMIPFSLTRIVTIPSFPNRMMMKIKL